MFTYHFTENKIPLMDHFYKKKKNLKYTKRLSRLTLIQPAYKIELKLSLASLAFVLVC